MGFLCVILKNIFVKKEGIFLHAETEKSVREVRNLHFVLYNYCVIEVLCIVQENTDVEVTMIRTLKALEIFMVLRSPSQKPSGEYHFLFSQQFFHYLQVNFFLFSFSPPNYYTCIDYAYISVHFYSSFVQF